MVFQIPSGFEFLTFLTLNYAILSLSTDIDVEQLIKDIKFITKNTFLIDNVFILISLTVAVFSFIQFDRVKMC